MISKVSADILDFLEQSPFEGSDSSGGGLYLKLRIFTAITNVKKKTQYCGQRGLISKAERTE